MGRTKLSTDDEMFQAYMDGAEEETEKAPEPKVDPHKAGITPGELRFDKGRIYMTDASGGEVEVAGVGGGTGLTGSVASSGTHMTSAASRRISSGFPPSTGTLGGGGMVYTTTTGTSTSPWATGGMLGPTTPTKPAKSKKNRFVRFPARFTQKVLLAFLDPDEKDSSKDVVWAANLPVIDIELTMSDEGRQELVITLSLEDKYDNNPEEAEE